MRWTPLDVATDTGGNLLPGPSEGSLEGVSIDSRSLQRGALFVPLRAARDGHDFLHDAVRAGAGGYLLEAGHPAMEHRPTMVPAVEVGDTRAALLDLGRAARRRLLGTVVGITGSVGKTSTKDLTAAALSRSLRTVASLRSFNNELGVPLTLANADPGTEAAVVEMGARGPGHIALLCRVAQPTIGVVTAVAAAHTEVLGDLKGVAAAKSELVQSLPPAGTAVLNADDEMVASMADRTSAEVLMYSATGQRGADIVAKDVVLGEDLRPCFRFASPWGEEEVRLEARGLHQVANALAAACVALRCGVPAAEVAEGLSRASLSPWRMEVHRTPAGAWVINDSYNANPASTSAALRALASLPARRRIALLGRMAELGARSRSEHEAVAGMAAELGIELVAVGTDEYGKPPASDPLAVVGPIGPGDAVLVKGSRAAGLEGLAEELLGRDSRP